MKRVPVRLLGALLALLSVAFPVRAEPAVLHHDIFLSIDPATGFVRIRDRFSPRSTDDLRFQLADWLEVKSARLGGAAREISRRGGGWQIEGKDAPGNLVLEIEGKLPANPSRRGGGALFSADGIYLPGSAAWIADTGDARLTYRLDVEIAAPEKAVATGRLVSENDGEKTYRAAFETERAGETPSVFAGPYRITERKSDDIRLRTYFHPEGEPWAEAYLDATAAFIARFADQVGPYPYADFHIISSPLPVGLGFPNLTYVSRRILHLPFMRGRSLAHEVLHSWLGNAIGVDYRKGNWSEGLTTYLADYGLARDEGGGRRMRLEWLRDYAALPADKDVAPREFVYKAHDALQVIGYSKVAFVFEMLRGEVGDAAFDLAIKNFWEEQKFRSAGWPEIEAVFEMASGRELGWFFDQWIGRAGAPELALASAERAEAADRYVTRIELIQSKPTFRIRIPMVVRTETGDQREIVTMTDRRQVFEIATTARPTGVAVDPDFALFRRLLDGESPPIIRDVTLGSATLIHGSDDPEFKEIASKLAARLLPGGGQGKANTSGPVLFIGTPERFEAWRESAGLPTDPLAGAGSGRAWVGRRDDRTPYMVVLAKDAAALAALSRPLPHYRRRSFVVFDGAKAIDKGVWKSDESPLVRGFE